MVKQVDGLSLGILLFTIICKFLLFLYCRDVAKRGTSVSVEAYSEDHFNDVFTNILVCIAAGLTLVQDGVLWFMDPVVAILMGLYILWSWSETAYQQIELLTGKTASPDQLKILTVRLLFCTILRENSLTKHHQHARLVCLRFTDACFQSRPSCG